MNRITHKQASRYMLADLDGLLTDAQRLDLHTHLDSCSACRADSESFATLTSRLQTEFHSRWDAQDGPSENVLKAIHSRSRRIIMKERIDLAFNIFGGIVTFLVLGFVVLAVISQFQKKAITANGTETNVPISAISEDGLIAFVMREENSNPEIYTMKSDGSDVANITNNPATDEFPAWSVDGTQIAFVSDRSGGRDIYRMNADGSNVRKLTDSSTFNDHFIWSPDGTKIAYLSSESSEGAFSGTDQLMVMNADGSNKIALAGPGSFMFLHWSPDGQKILFQDLNPLPNDSRMRYANVDGSFVGDGLMGIGNGIATRTHWENSDQYVFVNLGGTQEIPKWELVRFFATEDPWQYNGFGPVLASSDAPIVAIFDKTYVVENKDSLVWLPYEGAPIPYKPWNFSEKCAQPNDPYVEDSTHIISPDGQQAFVIIHCGEGVTWFYLENADGSQFVQLTDFSIADPATVSGINWSPDGKHVVVTISNTKGTNLYRFDIQEMLNDPSTQPIQLTTDDTVKYWAVWQPAVKNEVVEEKPTQTPTDNRLIAFTVVEQDGNTEIYTMRADGSNLTNLTNNEALDSNPAWSPDGKRIAFESNRAAFTQIYLMDADGSNVTQLTFDEIEHEMTMNYAQPNPWSPDGTHLLFFQRVYSEKGSPSVPLELYSMDINTGTKIMLAKGDIGLFDVSWAPDGRHVAYIVTDPQNPIRADLFVINSEGNNLIQITQSLHPNEQLANFDYYWLPDGQSLIFTTFNEISQQWFAYEASLDGSPLVLKTRVSSTLGDWRDGTSFIIGFQSTLTWLHSDGTTSTLNPIENCQFEQEPQYSFLPRRASNGNLIISIGCHNGDLWFYWANPDGTSIKQLLDAPISVKDGGLNDLVWSPDNKYVAISVFSSDANYFYVVNVEEALKDPSALPDPMGRGMAGYSIAWQPIP